MSLPGASNFDENVVRGFGDEWSRFDQTGMPAVEFDDWFDRFFHLFPWEMLPQDAVGFDLGCGSGRWAIDVAPRVGTLHCIDASSAALDVARKNLAHAPNVEFALASVDNIPLPDASMDFGYCLGVLHHVPDSFAGLVHAVSKIKSGAPFLLYMYYAFDNQPAWYRTIWKASNSVRMVVSRSPLPIRYALSQILATLVYFPLGRTARLLKLVGMKLHSFPLSNYSHRSFYSMRTDALDRFGTRIEQRFTREQLADMMTRAGLVDIRFSDRAPFWCTVGIKA